MRSNRWSGAYYLLGYAVECALKACVAKTFLEHVVPDRKLVEDFYQHRLDKLLVISGAKVAHATQTAADPQFLLHWNTVRDWSEVCRYDHAITRQLQTPLRECSHG